MTAQTVGWIGAGKMGGPISRRLIQAGHRVLVIDPDPRSRDLAADAGAGIAADFKSLAAEAQLLFSMIPDDSTLCEIVSQADGLAASMAPGSALVEMSTVSPAASQVVAASLAAVGVHYLRAPVSGSTSMAQAGTLSVIASGPRHLFDSVRPLLGAFSAKHFYVGEAEEARYLKLALNTLVSATPSILAEALALARKGGLSLDTILEVINQSSVASPLIGYKRDMLVSGDFTPHFTVEQMIKDLDIIVGTAAADHVPMLFTALVRQQYEREFAAGRAQQDFFVLCGPPAGYD
jgi:3-hydroxyisobutyrate dehydrogenase-like beta-hydroxyacid dehydrogenase